MLPSFFCFALNECLQLVYEEESVSGPVVLSLPHVGLLCLFGASVEVTG